MRRTGGVHVTVNVPLVLPAASVKLRLVSAPEDDIAEVELSRPGKPCRSTRRN